MTVFSPLNQPMAHHMSSGANFFGAGVKSTVTVIPAGWTQSFILSAGTGITDGMMAWGDRILKFTVSLQPSSIVILIIASVRRACLVLHLMMKRPIATAGQAASQHVARPHPLDHRVLD